MSLPRVLKQPDEALPAPFETFTPVDLSAASRGPMRQGVVRGGTAGAQAPPPVRPRVLRPGSVAEQTAPIRIAAPPLAAPVAEAATAAPPPPLKPDPLAEARQALADAEARHQEELKLARTEAFAAGRAEGREEAEAEHDAALTALREATAANLDQLAAVWRRHHERVEQQLVALAVEAATHLAAAPLPEAARNATGRAVVQAIESVGRGEGLHVRLHPVDFLHIQEVGMLEGLGASYPGLRWTPDEALNEGDWAVESSEAAVRHVRAELLDGLRARLGLLRAADDTPPPTGPRVAGPPDEVLPEAEVEADDSQGDSSPTSDELPTLSPATGPAASHFSE